MSDQKVLRDWFVPDEETCKAILKMIESIYPDARWYEGQEPTKFIPDDISEEGGVWICMNKDGNICWKSKRQHLEDLLAHDPVISPDHYTSGSIECIDAMVETQGVNAVQHFCICNAFKYLWRYRRKNGLEDIKKASWYLNKAIELEERGNE